MRFFPPPLTMVIFSIIEVAFFVTDIIQTEYDFLIKTFVKSIPHIFHLLQRTQVQQGHQHHWNIDQRTFRKSIHLQPMEA